MPYQYCHFPCESRRKRLGKGTRIKELHCTRHFLSKFSTGFLGAFSQPAVPKQGRAEGEVGPAGSIQEGWLRLGPWLQGTSLPSTSPLLTLRQLPPGVCLPWPGCPDFPSGLWAPLGRELLSSYSSTLSLQPGPLREHGKWSAFSDAQQVRDSVSECMKTRGVV